MRKCSPEASLTEGQLNKLIQNYKRYVKSIDHAGSETELVLQALLELSQRRQRAAKKGNKS